MSNVFKEFRKQNNLTQRQAGEIIGLSHSFWFELETNQLPTSKEAAYARVLKYKDHPLIDRLVNQQVMSQIHGLGLTAQKAGELIGSGYSTWKNLETGHNKMSVRYTRLINALLIELSESQPVQAESVSVSVVPVFDRSAVRTEIYNEQVWFNLVDVCAQVDYVTPYNALSLVDNEDSRKIHSIDSLGRNQEIWFLSEAGLYDFLLSSNVPKAKPFKKWVIKEVLPSIRKTGSYSVQSEPAYSNMPAWAESLLQQMGGGLIQMRQDMDLQESKIAHIQSVVESLPAQAVSVADAAQATIEALQSLRAKKAELHDLVISIVNAARALPNDDTEAQYYSKYQNTWRTVHRHARPAVSAKDDYTTIEQVQSAIDGGRLILARLGGSVQLGLAF